MSLDHIHADLDELGRLEVAATGAIEIEPNDDGTHTITINAAIGDDLRTLKLTCTDLRLEDDAANPLLAVPELIAPDPGDPPHPD